MAVEPEPYLPSLEEVRLLYAAAGVELADLIPAQHGGAGYLATVNGTYLEVIAEQEDAASTRRYLLQRLKAFVDEERYQNFGKLYSRSLANALQQTREHILSNVMITSYPKDPT